MKAQDELHNYILIKNLLAYDLEVIVKYIANKNQESFNSLHESALSYQKELLRDLGLEEPEDQKNFKNALNTKTNLYRRADAIRRIKNQELLVKLYKKVNNPYLKKEIIKLCNSDEIFDLALKDGDESLKIETIKAIHNRMKLRWAAETCDSERVKIEAVKKIFDPHTLQKIILSDSSIEVKKAALNQIRSVSVLEALQNTIPPKYNEYVTERINVLTGTDDYIKQSIESLIQAYH